MTTKHTPAQFAMYAAMTDYRNERDALVAALRAVQSWMDDRDNVSISDIEPLVRAALARVSS